MANLRIKAKGGKSTTILWTVKKSHAPELSPGSEATRFYAMRSDGVLLSRTSSTYFTTYGIPDGAPTRVHDSGHWTVLRRGITDDEQGKLKASLVEQKGYTLC